MLRKSPQKTVTSLPRGPRKNCLPTVRCISLVSEEYDRIYVLQTLCYFNDAALMEENYTKKKRQEEANSSLAADIKQRMSFWLEIQYRQKSGKKCINYLDKRSLTQMWKGQGGKSSEKLLQSRKPGWL